MTRARNGAAPVAKLYRYCPCCLAGLDEIEWSEERGDECLVILPDGRSVPAKPCPCGDGSCVECDDRGMRPSELLL